MFQQGQDSPLKSPGRDTQLRPVAASLLPLGRYLTNALWPTAADRHWAQPSPHGTPQLILDLASAQAPLQQ